MGATGALTIGLSSPENYAAIGVFSAGELGGGENVIRKHFKLTEETAKLLAERSKAENMNESEYICSSPEPEYHRCHKT